MTTLNFSINVIMMPDYQTVINKNSQDDFFIVHYIMFEAFTDMLMNLMISQLVF